MQDKVRPTHRQRAAIVYVRQSTISQVRFHHESTERQYALRDRALEMGWPDQAVRVIDEDLGVSGSSTEGRTGFQSLVAEVSLGQVGAIFGLEVSRLARSSADWHRLLELCALFDTLIVDADGIYDLADFNDRLVLGLKGTMSEAELHLLRGRLLGGKLNKARKGELHAPLPVGFVFDAAGRIVLDPDEEVQGAIRTLFDAFHRTGTAFAVVQHFAKEGLRFPKRAYGGAWNGRLLWGPLTHGRVLGVLKNPAYAGTYVFGRYHYRRRLAPDGRLRSTQVSVPPEEWQVRLDGHHPGYITLEEFDAIQARLRQNRTNAVVSGAAREGSALLQGLIFCGECGRRMSVHYISNGKPSPHYECAHGRRDGIPGPHARSVSGRLLDEAVSRHVLAALTPEQFELVFKALTQLREDRATADRTWNLRLERAQYEADLSERQFELVDPENRLVARSLERRWDERLQELEALRNEYRAYTTQQTASAPPITHQQALDLAHDLPRLWNAPTTSIRDRKRILRLLVSDITVMRVPDRRESNIGIRWTGGRCDTITVTHPTLPYEKRRSSPETIELIRQLTAEHSDPEIVTILNDRGLLSPTGQPFTYSSVSWIRWRYHIPTPMSVPDEFLSVDQAAKHLGVSRGVIYDWILGNLLPATKLAPGRPWCISLDPETEARLRRRVAASGHLQPRDPERSLGGGAV